ncbi:MAG: Zn-ribbon domain-containing OB-fold protein [Candidatus Diapherotrites archaeon]|uniref:Zn-ribbon domain-containing OB-fold protein n=1 Tax=Candidatus Iainarchaeum sp. TaxID=3101447 RepID=A0A8T4LC72_9ARCH|nr:Zn-ribbon domain-containing OB-fold protein [Candidatus Diapherotrites archaeon]
MVEGSVALHWRRYPERYSLIGNHCATCKTDYFPPRVFCHNCRRKGKLIVKDMPRTGKIVAFTEVFVGPVGFENETPYFLALIDLGNGVILLTQIVDSSRDRIQIGANVKMMFRKIQDNDKEGVINYGYKFKVTE